MGDIYRPNYKLHSYTNISISKYNIIYSISNIKSYESITNQYAMR